MIGGRERCVQFTEIVVMVARSPVRAGYAEHLWSCGTVLVIVKSKVSPLQLHNRSRTLIQSLHQAPGKFLSVDTDTAEKENKDI